MLAWPGPRDFEACIRVAVRVLHMYFYLAIMNLLANAPASTWVGNKRKPTVRHPMSTTTPL